MSANDRCDRNGRRAADELLAVALASGKTVAQAAEAANVSEPTVYRRLRLPAFKTRVDELRSSAVAAALGRLTDGMAMAADALNELVKNGDPDVRHRASCKVLELALRVKDSAEMDARLRAVEEQLRGKTDGRHDGETEGGGERGEGAAAESAGSAGEVPGEPGGVVP